MDLGGRPPLRFFRFACKRLKYSEPRFAIFLPPFRPRLTAAGSFSLAKTLRTFSKLRRLLCPIGHGSPNEVGLEQETNFKNVTAGGWKLGVHDRNSALNSRFEDQVRESSETRTLNPSSFFKQFVLSWDFHTTVWYSSGFGAAYICEQINSYRRSVRPCAQPLVR